jgi:hypothetical protein
MNYTRRELWLTLIFDYQIIMYFQITVAINSNNWIFEATEELL